MKNLLLSLFFTLTFAINSAYARTDGGSHGGGGDSLVADFVMLGNSLLEGYPLEEQDRSALQRALSESKIVAVPALSDPTNGTPIADQRTLIAWGSPGLVQIKLDDGSAESWEKLRREGKPVLHIVFHELYRAAGAEGKNGKSPDDSFQLSMGKYRLHTQAVAGTCERAVREAAEAYGREELELDSVQTLVENNWFKPREASATVHLRKGAHLEEVSVKFDPETCAVAHVE